MSKFILLFLMPAVLCLSGCASESYVKTQIDPITERLGMLESRVSRLEEKKTDMSSADRAALMKVDEKAQQALDKANRLSSDFQRAALDAARAEEAAVRAENAAKQAGQSEKRAVKLFELNQKK